MADLAVQALAVDYGAPALGQQAMLRGRGARLHPAVSWGRGACLTGIHLHQYHSCHRHDQMQAEEHMELFKILWIPAPVSLQSVLCLQWWTKQLDSWTGKLTVRW